MALLLTMAIPRRLREARVERDVQRGHHRRQRHRHAPPHARLAEAHTGRRRSPAGCPPGEGVGVAEQAADVDRDIGDGDEGAPSVRRCDLGDTLHALHEQPRPRRALSSEQYLSRGPAARGRRAVAGSPGRGTCSGCVVRVKGS
eukprot:scaffold69556_cov63-Phaeocystis_antarctica.AAC.2